MKAHLIISNKSWHPASYVTLELLFASSLIRWQPGDPAAEIRQRETGIFIFLAIPGARADNMRRVTDTRDCCHPPLPILLETGIKMHPLPHSARYLQRFPVLLSSSAYQPAQHQWLPVLSLQQKKQVQFLWSYFLSMAIIHWACWDLHHI